MKKLRMNLECLRDLLDLEVTFLKELECCLTTGCCTGLWEECFNCRGKGHHTARCFAAFVLQCLAALAHYAP